MRAANYVRSSDGEPDVPALHRISGIPDSILRRWLAEEGNPSWENLKLLAPALGVEVLELLVKAEMLTLQEARLVEDPGPPPKKPTPEEMIMSDDLLSNDEKTSLVQLYRSLRDHHSTDSKPRRRKRA